jgi:hypothetical protein
VRVALRPLNSVFSIGSMRSKKDLFGFHFSFAFTALRREMETWTFSKSTFPYAGALLKVSYIFAGCRVRPTQQQPLSPSCPCQSPRPQYPPPRKSLLKSYLFWQELLQVVSLMVVASWPRKGVGRKKREEQ